MWELLRRHGWSWQQPARRAIERDEAAVAGWVKETWPRAKPLPRLRLGRRSRSAEACREEPQRGAYNPALCHRARC
ncbi:winged helix-turn-helix domain-containing protein [Streptomyces sp. YS415]|uniref:helix-turn-helix domain-containing protein n=1 Tax=Streptomyces sp. YS415 TaxID=2944806 RepID=UPI002021B799|nr:winged helix-turn-helix domain-containing protein [Streptomyces sp. YS415]MCL7429856.1 winged helix-turn-helix domain-containing protein [Streptomyces sp. YS415]